MTDTSSLTLKPCVMVRVLQRSPVREIRTPGSARGLSGNRQFYLNISISLHEAAHAWAAPFVSEFVSSRPTLFTLQRSVGGIGVGSP